ncbi:hypothetical protein HJC23_012634 [Cyclotella cryptica]|uniref:Uncharacterized protein n=1 Tax=Cyclotella cryptica TaxID=29204 RepID=A0ABD3QLE5_9STRA|eukprot:CCRYP_004169-RB/>CCRYP_004169-RB protein AED:0.02 eAED:0.02 QI:387/-1/1/1/-1/1/1/217/676
MPPFQPNQRRFDPYDDPLPNSTINNAATPHHASSIRQQRLPVGAPRSPRDAMGSSSIAFHAPTYSAPQHHHLSIPMRPYVSDKHQRLDTIGRILAEDCDDFDHRQPRRNSYRDPRHDPTIDVRDDRRNHMTGAANLGSHVHPLLAAKQHKRRARVEHYKDKPVYRHHPHPHEPSLSALLAQVRRILALLLGQIHYDDDDALSRKLSPQTEEEILMRLLSSKSTLRTLRLFLLLPLLFYAYKRYLPPLADKITRPAPWKWSAGVSFPGLPAQNRNLAGRNCVMNYFIEKQPKDEYDPDYVEIKPGENKPNNHNPPPVTIVEGTYRTKGQIHVISRFIEAVADSFRSNTNIRQHLIFTETRDSGHLAYEATRHWPPRGKHRTMVHVVAAEESVDPSDVAARALGYGSLEDIEERFRGMEKARIYDREGNVAGLVDEEGVDDDEALKEMMEMEVPDGETMELRMRSAKKKGGMVNSTILSDGTAYPNLRAMLPFEEEDEEGEIIVPYLHVDGMSMAHQMHVLEAARSLLQDKTVVVVGVEHSPDMNVRKLIAFFKEVDYKTFFLGARQIARIDNLCEEVLDDVLEHPSVSPPDVSPLRRLFMKVGLISKDELRIVPDTPTAAAASTKKRQTPPFFVAMPRGRKNKEEMTIQHMYDLFGGYGGGGGQIATANDRKAPGKK